MTQAQFCRLWLLFRDKVTAQRELLNQLDAAIGDADHGTNMSRGLDKVATYCQNSQDGLGPMCKAVGMTLLSTVGGASGALWGASLLKMAQLLPDRDRADDAEMVRAIEAFVDAVKQRGGAQRGDKTMVDVWEPAVAYLTERQAAGVPFAQAVQDVAKQAAGWADATQPLVAKKGRAAYLGSRSQGHIDPGSYSTALWWQALAEAVTP